MKTMGSAPTWVRAVREAIALRLLRRIQRITHRMPVRLREIQPASVLVVAPHMDDEIIGPGGTLLLHREIGSRISVLFCAGGASAEEDRVRNAEAKIAVQAIGATCTEWLNLPDGRLSLHEESMCNHLARKLAQDQIDLIFIPFVTDHHRDHAAVSAALASAIKKAGWTGEVWCYEVWSPLWPNVAVDISGVAEAKRAVIELYSSQVNSLHYTDGILGLNRYRGLKVYVNHAEAFFVADAQAFCSLAAEMNHI